MKIVRESLGIDFDKDEMVDLDNKTLVNKVPRFLFHISEPIFRDEILENGLIPQDANKSKWSSQAKASNKDILFKNSIFATPYKDSIDAYEIKHISEILFPLPITEEYLSPENIEKLDDLKQSIMDEYKQKMKIIRKNYKNERNQEIRAIRAMDLSEEYGEIYVARVNKFIMEHTNIDVWLIDSKGLKNKWYEDKHAGSYESYFTHEVIPPHHLELIKPDNENIFSDLDFE